MEATGEPAGASARVAASPVPSAAAGDRGHVHIGAVVDSADELAATAIAFVDDGLRSGDLVVLACPADTAERVRRALGERAASVEADDRIALAGTRAPDAFALHHRLLERAASSSSGRLRVLGEVVFGGDALAHREGERYEAAANAVLAGLPLTAMCLYDRSVLPPEIVDIGRATHPLLHGPDGARQNPGFQEPGSYLRGLPVPREPVEDRPPTFEVQAARSLPSLRHAFGAVLDVHVRDEEQRGDIYLGLSEVAANAFRHGRRPVSARLWTDGDRLVCTVTDTGRAFDDPLAGFVPAHGMDLGRGGMGLWLARKLFDSVDLLVGEEGLTVRLSTALRPADGDVAPAAP